MRAPPPAPALAAHHRGGAPRAPAGACSCGGLAVHQPSGAACLSLATCMRRRRRRLLRRPRCNAPSPPSSPVGAWKIEKEKRARLIKLRRPLLSPALAGRFDSHALQNATATAPRPSFEATGKKKNCFFLARRALLPATPRELRGTPLLLLDGFLLLLSPSDPEPLFSIRVVTFMPAKPMHSYLLARLKLNAFGSGCSFYLPLASDSLLRGVSLLQNEMNK